MPGSVYGNIFKISTWGESHGKAIGVVIDGCPSGIALCENDFITDMARRKPGNSGFTSKRIEDDTVEILSGVFEGKTTGTSISLIIYNKDQRSKDYSEISKLYRPGHADYTYNKKYGFRDYRGGGRSSGRETAARVAAGVIAKKILTKLQCTVKAYTLSIGGICADIGNLDMEAISKNQFSMPDMNAAAKVEEFLSKTGDSYGGIIECTVLGLKAGIGEPVFDKLDAAIAKAILSIGAVKGVEFGSGFNSANMPGSENNDEIYIDNGVVKKRTNNAGGIAGGISDGSSIIFRCAIKPTPSISKTQRTIDIYKNEQEITIKGRHDKVIVPRAVVVVEAMVAVTLVDYLFVSMANNIDNVVSFFKGTGIIG